MSSDILRCICLLIWTFSQLFDMDVFPTAVFFSRRILVENVPDYYSG